MSDTFLWTPEDPTQIGNGKNNIKGGTGITRIEFSKTTVQLKKINRTFLDPHKIFCGFTVSLCVSILKLF